MGLFDLDKRSRISISNMIIQKFILLDYLRTKMTISVITSENILTCTEISLQAKDVNLGLRPLSDFEDPRLKEDVNKADFESILQVAVLCVAKSSKGRPTIDIVFEEMDKVWHNTQANKVSRS